jgi:hypothetical protein
MALKIAFATSTCAVSWRGGKIQLRAGDAWDGDDPFVKANRHLFSTDTSHLHRTEHRPVEQATASPGERRTLA